MKKKSIKQKLRKFNAKILDIDSNKVELLASFDVAQLRLLDSLVVDESTIREKIQIRITSW